MKTAFPFIFVIRKDLYCDTYTYASLCVLLQTSTKRSLSHFLPSSLPSFFTSLISFLVVLPAFPSVATHLCESGYVSEGLGYVLGILGRQVAR